MFAQENDNNAKESKVQAEEPAADNTDNQQQDTELTGENTEKTEKKNEQDRQDNIENKKEDSRQEEGELSSAEELQLLQEENEKLEEEKASLQEENKKLNEELEKFKSQYQRLRADFENYRKRTRQEKDGFGLEGQIELLEKILPILDNFERALDNAEGEDGDFGEGVGLIYKQLMNTLQQHGLEIIESEGQPFDHKYHEAIMQIEDTDSESGTVVEELQKGYLFKGKLIRPAMVKVAE